MEVKQLAFYKCSWEVKHMTTEKQIQLVLKASSKLGLHDASSIFSTSHSFSTSNAKFITIFNVNPRKQFLILRIYTIPSKYWWILNILNRRIIWHWNPHESQLFNLQLVF